MRFTPRDAIDQRFFSADKKTDDFKVGEKIIFTWSYNWANFLAEKINANHHDTTMYNSTYWFKTNLEKNISVVHGPVGSPGTVMFLEDLITCGAQEIIGLGAAGSLKKDFQIGDILIPYYCKIIDEGTSQHYKIKGEIKPDEKLFNQLKDIFIKSDINTGAGDWWTTDGFYRETKNDIKKYSDKGILGVDMETSAMYKLGMYRKVSICNLLIVSDELHKEWKYDTSSKNFQTNYLKVINLISSWILN
ncbi:MAG: nucleoside phosphorylase [Dehalococcoidia bacterium]